jgi:1-acyl-sn-glycerol-3-phosphate acyltransferase
MPLSALLMHLLGAVRVEGRGTDAAALRRAMDALERGVGVVVFPEGERSRTGGLMKGQPGAALLANRAHAPIVPVAITGTERVSWPWVLLLPFLGPAVDVCFGEPFTLAPAKELDTAAAAGARTGTDAVMRHIALLLPPEYRGEYRESAPPDEGLRS